MAFNVSVVIPAYNASRFIGETLDSIFAQSHPPLEVIVVNDGSTDDTAELIKREFPRVRLIERPNGGVSRARNTGIRACCGDYIAFVDADDLWEPEKLERQLAAFRRYPQAGLAINDECLFDERVYCASGMAKCRFCGELPAAAAPLAKPVSWLIQESFVSTSSVLVRADVVQRAGLFEEGLQIGEDRDYWIKLALLAEVLYIPEVLVRKRENHGQNLSHISSLKWARGLFRVIRRHDTPATRARIEAEGEQPNRLFGANYLNFGRIFWYANEIDEARRSLAEAVRNDAPGARRLALFAQLPRGVITMIKALKARL